MLIFFRRHRVVRGGTAVAALVCLQACYSWAAVPSRSTPQPGERVRLVLTPEGTTELARFLGPNVAVAEGRFTIVDADSSLRLAVDIVQTTNGLQQHWTGEGTVGFPPQYVSELQQRTLDRGRSIVAATALTVSLIVTAILALRSGGAGSGGQPPPPPPPT